MESSPAVIWRNKPYRYRLEVRKCPKCGRIFREEVTVCPKCDVKTERLDLPPRGRLLSWTKVCQVPEGLEDYSPIYFGLIELEDGNRIVAKLVDVLEEPKEGMEVEAVLRRVKVDGQTGLIEYAVCFRPAF